MCRPLVPLLLLALTACGKEQPILDVVTGSFQVGQITCNGGDPGATIAAMFETPSVWTIAVTGAVVRHTREAPGCTIINDSAISYQKPGNLTEYRMFETTGGAYACVPATCDASCGTAVAPVQIEYDLILKGDNLDLYSTDTHPLCAGILFTASRI